MAIKLSTHALIELLNAKNMEPTYQKEHDQVYITMNISNSEVPLFFGIRGEGTLLQTIAYLPYELQDKTMGQVARLLHLINRELDMPGFGMDEKEKLMFYRLVLPCLQGDLNEKLFELYLMTSRIACETFMKAIALIASGAATVDDILKQQKPNG